MLLKRFTITTDRAISGDITYNELLFKSLWNWYGIINERNYRMINQRIKSRFYSVWWENNYVDCLYSRDKAVNQTQRRAYRGFPLWEWKKFVPMYNLYAHRTIGRLEKIGLAQFNRSRTSAIIEMNTELTSTLSGNKSMEFWHQKSHVQNYHQEWYLA